MAKSYINKAEVKRYALDYAERNRNHAFTRVSKKFLDQIDFMVAEIIRRSVKDHPTVGKTLTEVR